MFIGYKVEDLIFDFDQDVLEDGCYLFNIPFYASHGTRYFVHSDDAQRFEQLVLLLGFNFRYLA